MNEIKFFNLPKKDDSAIVRLLHTSIQTIESAKVHRMTVEGKTRVIKCIGTDCPICKHFEDKSSKQVYIHLYDYTDNCEKVWIRTDKIINQFKEIEENWGNLSECVLKITRETDEFPKYNVIPVNASKYASVSNDLVDSKISYRFYLTRSEDELEEFSKTGIIPPHKKKENTNNSSSSRVNSAESVKVSKSTTSQITDDEEDPFI